MHPPTVWQQREKNCLLVCSSMYSARGSTRSALRNGFIKVENEVGHHLYTSIGFREVARQVHFFADLSKSQSAQDTSESD